MICKSFKKFKICPSVNNNLYEKPDSLVQILSDDSLKVIPTHHFLLVISAQQVVNPITLWGPCIGFVVCGWVQNLK